MPFLGMHAAGPKGGLGAAAPGAFWELFCGEKFPAGGQGKAVDVQHAAPAAEVSVKVPNPLAFTSLTQPLSHGLRHDSSPWAQGEPWVLRYKQLSAATVPSTRGRFAARTRSARPYDVEGKMRVKLPCARSNPCSGVVRAALVEAPVAVTANRFYWAARSREGVGSMERDDPVECNGPGDAFSWDARRRVPRGTGGRSPRRILGTFLR